RGARGRALLVSRRLTCTADETDAEDDGETGGPDAGPDDLHEEMHPPGNMADAPCRPPAMTHPHQTLKRARTETSVGPFSTSVRPLSGPSHPCSTRRPNHTRPTRP